jgi:hypothetical protein
MKKRLYVLLAILLCVTMLTFLATPTMANQGNPGNSGNGRGSGNTDSNRNIIGGNQGNFGNSGNGQGAGNTGVNQGNPGNSGNGQGSDNTGVIQGNLGNFSNGQGSGNTGSNQGNPNNAENRIAHPRTRGITMLYLYVIRNGATEKCEVILQWEGTDLYSAWKFTSCLVKSTNLLFPTTYGTIDGSTKITGAMATGTVLLGYVNIPTNVTHVSVNVFDVQGYCYSGDVGFTSPIAIGNNLVKIN